MLHYFRTTNDGRIAFGWGGGRMAYDARPDRRLEIDADVVARAAAALHRFFPLLKDRAITHAWGGPIDVAPSRLPIYRSRGSVHAGWGFTGHGVGPSHLGGRILSGLALGVRDEVTTLPLVEPPVKTFPPEPARWIGGSLIRAALIRKDLLDEQGRDRRPDYPRRRAAAATAGPQPAALSAGAWHVRVPARRTILPPARVLELEYRVDSKSTAREGLWVRIPPRVLLNYWQDVRFCRAFLVRGTNRASGRPSIYGRRTPALSLNV